MTGTIQTGTIQTRTRTTRTNHRSFDKDGSINSSSQSGNGLAFFIMWDRRLACPADLEQKLAARTGEPPVPRELELTVN
jgi:hypothetical protein